jgi:predicted HicB family RNase H-like nuclease
MAFEETVDEYLDCEQLQQKPDKPNHGKIFLRIDPEIHRAAIITAELQSKSLNQ